MTKTKLTVNTGKETRSWVLNSIKEAQIMAIRMCKKYNTKDFSLTNV